uniref:Cyclic nucleotide-binding domain-containing protein n=1 Tax=Plectus sambesii TaxID=2011161 RepID=A0A914WPI2_9BILA
MQRYRECSARARVQSALFHHRDRRGLPELLRRDEEGPSDHSLPLQRFARGSQCYSSGFFAKPNTLRRAVSNMSLGWSKTLSRMSRSNLRMAVLNESTGESTSVGPSTPSKNGTLTTADSWDHDSDKLHNYVTAYSLSCSVLLLVSGHTALRPHRRKTAQLFMVVEQITGLLMLALVLGYVANLVSQLSNARRQFQKNLDVVKTYMRLRRVPAYLQMKVIRWFDYLWHTQRLGDESEALNCLPDRLKGEIAIQVHLNTLKRVEIFRNTEPGFLCELVLRLEPLLFSPGDYVCRKGEVGKEMYIVNGGKLRVINDELGTVLATLTAGAYFGEISLLNVGTEGNRRTASVLSVGYSELLCLSKKDIWEVLEDYPTARERLEEIARKRLEEVRKQKANSADTNKTADSNDRVGSIDSMTRRASAPALALRSTRILSIPKPSPGSIRRNLPFVQESASGEADGDEVDVSKSSSCEYIDEGGRI